jgi:hypothetical protein
VTDWPPHVFAGYTHIPLVRFDGLEKIDLRDGGALVRLPFGVWNLLDGAFPDEHRKYERTAPVFFRAQYPIEDLQEADVEQAFAVVLEELEHASTRVHLALLLATSGRIPEPTLSAAYVKRWATGQYVRKFGPFEREAILFGDRERTEWVVESSETLAIIRAYELVSREDPLLTDQACLRALDTLRLTARPEYSLANGFVLTVAALDSLLNPAAERPLGATFARRAAALFGDANRSVDDVRQFCKQLYSVRSQLVHGGDPTNPLKKLGLDAGRCFFLGRSLLAQALVRFARWTSGRADADWTMFRRDLDQAGDDRSMMATMRAAWAEPEN